MSKIQATLQSHGLSDVLVGWEHNFLLPEDAYIVAFRDMSWTACDEIKMKLTEIVLVSSSKAIIKFEPSLAIERMKHLFKAYNALHGVNVHKMFGYDGKLLWSEHMQPPSDKLSSHASTSVEIRLVNATAKHYRALIASLVSSVQNSMVKQVFDFGTSGIVVDWASVKRKRSNPITLKFPSVITARAFHYQYKDFEWESEEGTQTIILDLRHEAFDIEMRDSRVRLAVSSFKEITPDAMKSITGAISN